jgi:hypothetical protein
MYEPPMREPLIQSRMTDHTFLDMGKPLVQHGDLAAMYRAKLFLSVKRS